MELIIRKTEKSDFYQTEHITRESFWNMYKPGCDEHLVLHQIRKSKCYIDKLDFIAIYQGEIIGHIISTLARVTDKNDHAHEVLCVGPVAVLPDYQNRGTGTSLLNHSIAEAKKLGYKGMILFGDPGYYHRFGFTNAGKYEITTKDGQNFEPFMALELTGNGLADVKGRFFEDEAFTVSEDELPEFEMNFPAKEKGKPKIDISIID